MAKLAIPTFVTGAKDDVAAVDVYTQTSDVTINDFAAIPVPAELTAAGGLRASLFTKNGLQDAVAVIRSVGALASGNAANALDKIAALNNVLAGPLSKVSPGLLNEMLGDPRSPGTIVATVGGVSQNIKTSNIDSISSIGKLIGTATGNPSAIMLMGQDTNAAALSGIISTSANKGLPNTLAAMVSLMPDTKTVNAVVTGCLSALIKSSDITSLHSAASLSTPGTVKLLNRNVIKDFSNKYHAPPNTTVADNVTNYAAVRNTYNAIDSAWDQTIRVTTDGADVATTLVPTQNASDDFLKMFRIGGLLSTNPDEKLQLLATKFPSTGVVSEINKQFSTLGISDITA